MLKKYFSPKTFSPLFEQTFKKITKLAQSAYTRERHLIFYNIIEEEDLLSVRHEHECSINSSFHFNNEMSKIILI